MARCDPTSSHRTTLRPTSAGGFLPGPARSVQPEGWHEDRRRRHGLGDAPEAAPDAGGLPKPGARPVVLCVRAWYSIASHAHSAALRPSRVWMSGGSSSRSVRCHRSMHPFASGSRARVFAIDVTVCRKCGGRMRVLLVVDTADDTQAPSSRPGTAVPGLTRTKGVALDSPPQSLRSNAVRAALGVRYNARIRGPRRAAPRRARYSARREIPG